MFMSLQSWHRSLVKSSIIDLGKVTASYKFAANEPRYAESTGTIG